MMCFLWLLLATALLVRRGEGHGRMIEPPQRSSMWRFGFSTPPNYNDNELFCGGRQMIQKLGGLCGVCGDPYHGKRDNEAGGKYATGTIARSYPAGSPTITVRIELTAYHKGHYEFRLCPHNNPSQPVTQECLNRYPLPVAEAQDQGEPTHYKPERGGIHELTLLLPPGMTCSQCVLQWRYRTGNSWGTDTDSKHCLGCGVQEEFRNCADISIGDSSSGSVTKKPVVQTQRVPVLESVDVTTHSPLLDKNDPFGNEQFGEHHDKGWLEPVLEDPTFIHSDPIGSVTADHSIPVSSRQEIESIIPLPVDPIEPIVHSVSGTDHSIPESPVHDPVVINPLPGDSKLQTSLKKTQDTKTRQPIESLLSGNSPSNIDFRLVDHQSNIVQRLGNTRRITNNQPIRSPDLFIPNDQTQAITSRGIDHKRKGTPEWNRQGLSEWGRKGHSDLNRKGSWARQRVFHRRTPSQIPRRNEYFIEPQRQSVFNRQSSRGVFRRVNEGTTGLVNQPRAPLQLDSILRLREPQGERIIHRGWEQHQTTDNLSDDILSRPRTVHTFHDATATVNGDVSGSAIEAQRIRDLWWKIVILNKLKRDRELLLSRNLHTLENSDHIKAPFALAHRKVAPKVVHMLPPDEQTRMLSNEQKDRQVNSNTNSIVKKSDNTANTKNIDSQTQDVKTYKNQHNTVSSSSLEGSNSTTSWYDKILNPPKKLLKLMAEN